MATPRRSDRPAAGFLAALVLVSAAARCAGGEPPAPLVITSDTTLDPARTYGPLVIRASNVTIDGKGAWLVGATHGSPKSFTGTAISAKGVSGITLKNVKAKGWRTGLAVEDTGGWRVEDCDFSDNFHDPEFGWGEQGRGGGMVLTRVRSSTVRRCKANRVWDGCALVGCDDNLLEDNDFSHASNTCLKLWRSCGNTVRKNKLDYGLRIKPGEVHARDSACVLIETGSDDSRFVDNSCTHGGDGIFIRVLNGWVSTGNHFEGNDCSHANNNCVEAWAPRNRYVRNKANRGSYGFWLGASDQTVLLDNEASYNGDPKGPHNSPHLPGGGHAGIVFMFGPSSHTLVRGNRCVGNNGAGIALVGDLDSQGKKWKAFHWVIENNTLADNRWGIFAQHADWVDLAANRFRNNKGGDVHLEGRITKLTQHPDDPAITRPPAAVLEGPSSARVGEKVVLDASRSSDPDRHALRYRWDLGDGTVSDAARLEHAFGAPGFYRIGLTVNNGRLSDLAWRDFYVVEDVAELGTEGQAAQWSWVDPGSKVVFRDDRRVKIAGASSTHAHVEPYSGGRVSLLYPAARKAAWSLEGKKHLVFWLRARKEAPWQDANPVITLHETEKKFVRLAPREDLLGKPAFNEAREGWWYVVVPLAGDGQWQREGPDLAEVNFLTIGFDTWDYPPLDLWLDGLGLK
jgi:parallel beta-helix repeat protein